jgi:hypothetical protein
MAAASVEEVLGGVEAVAVAVVAGPLAPAATAAPTATGPMKWNNATSGFVLRRMTQLSE